MNKVRLPRYRITKVLHPLSEIMDWSSQYLGIPDVQKQTMGKGVKVAILDTGIDINHPDLKDAVASAKDFTNSHTGYLDVAGHGTWCAGYIGARANDIGIRGLMPECSLYIGKVLDDDGSGTEDQIIAGASWALAQNVDLVSMSFGGDGMSENLHQIFKLMSQNGLFPFAAMGNDGKPMADEPARWPELIAVGAVGQDGKPTDFSNYGPRVDIWAPGFEMLSTIPVTQGSYGKMSGTSMATPCAVGCSGLALAKDKLNPIRKIVTVADMKAELKATAQHGVIGPAAMMQYVASTPTSPTSPAVPPPTDPNAGFATKGDVAAPEGTYRILFKKKV